MNPTDFILTGKTAVVTGAGRGLGRGIALGLAACGAKVVCAARTVEEIDSVAEEIRSADGEAISVPTDISSRSDCRRVVEQAVEHYRRLDIMVVNAAVPRYAPAESVSEQDWNEVMAVGLTGYFNCAQAAGVQMIRQGGGSIVMMSANMSIIGFAEGTPVGTAKAGIDQMCRNLAVEWGGHEIRVNSVNPGYTEHDPSTYDVSPGGGEDADEDIRRMTPLGRVATVDEIVAPVVFLASNASSFITGVSVMVDGGYFAK